ncbi:pyocin activator PrtN family protein [Leisingera sp.]|uniref:pyocin activator PrtN family protein n=1 Tax=Leisingera sp. TaxID=1879318 RepID=UPI002B26C423|nr:pyocin activator PrtN family protein [Leisingera sp.]
MNTIWLLAGRYDGLPTVPLDKVREDFFGGMTKPVFTKKVESGEIPLPVTTLGSSQKAPRVIHLTDLAAYLDGCADKARKELERKVR